MERNTPVIGTVGLGGESVFLSVDHFHAPGETLQASVIFTEPGGKAFNQAVAARRLGAEVMFFGAMGQDPAGTYCTDFLESQGITPVVDTLADHATAYACILTDKNGENQVTVARGASQQLSANFFKSRDSDIQKCNVMLLGLECPLEATKAVLELCKKHKIYSILNPAPAISLDFSFLRSFDLITPNLQEATTLLDLQVQPDLRTLVEHILQAELCPVVVTLGSQGSLLVEDGHALLYPARKVSAVDTTGAGDTFNAALAVILGKGGTLGDAVEYATNAAAYSVCYPRVMGSLPTAEDLADFFEPLVPSLL